MISINDYRKPDGSVDWERFEDAQIDAGEICFRCRSIRPLYIEDILRQRSGKYLCGSCSAIDNDASEVLHETFVRCPHCKETFSPEELYHRDPDYGEYLEGGSHRCECRACGKEVAFSTRIHFTFVSPALEDLENQSQRKAVLP